MDKNRDTQKASTNTGDSVSSEVKTIKIKQGIWRTYDATDGLPGDPLCLLQDSRGYLWIGTRAGLCRYDGTEFITYTTSDGLAGNDIGNLCVDDQGRLWIGTDNGLSCLDDGQLLTYTTSDGLPDNQVYALCAGRQGEIWVVTSFGLSCFDGQQFTNYAIDVDYHSTICQDNRGQLWIGSGYKAKGVYCFNGQQFRTYTYEDGLVGNQNLFMAVYEDHQGRVWFGGWDGVSCFDGSGFINYTAADGIRAVFDVLEDSEGQMWFSHGQMSSLSCFDENTIQLITDQPAGWDAAQDKGGRIWFDNVSELYGVCFDTESSEVQQRKLSFGMGLINLMTDSSNRLWISEYREGLHCYDSADAAWRKAGGEEIPEPRYFSRTCDDSDESNVVPMFEEEDGTVWSISATMDEKGSYSTIVIQKKKCLFEIYFSHL
ncbi:two-component regulator propeller domain-containing protein, partial [Candidatus Poribacteria bacterium]